jgi:hypothetical protein
VDFKELSQRSGGVPCSKKLEIIGMIEWHVRDNSQSAQL